jgi:hypothetical protein
MPVIPGVIPSEAAKRRSRGIAIVPAAMSWFRCGVQKRTQISQISQISQITLIPQMGAYSRTETVCAICERALSARLRDLRRLLDDGMIRAMRLR